MEYLTMVEAAKLQQDPLVAGVIEIFPRVSPVLERLPFETIKGGSLTYNREQTMPGISFRGIGETYTPDTGVLNPITEVLKIFGGVSQVDRALVKTQGAVNDLRAVHDGMKAKSAALEFTDSFFHGDSTTDPKQFDGLDRRLVGNQLMDMDGTLTLAVLDQFLDRVIGRAEVIFCNKTIRRRINTLMRAAGQSTETVDDAFGRQIPAYAGIPIAVIEEGRDGNDILDFGADANSTLACGTSLYACRFGVREFLAGIQAGVIEVIDQGLAAGSIFYNTLIEHLASICIFHTRSAARLRHITDDQMTCTTTTTTTV